MDVIRQLETHKNQHQLWLLRQPVFFYAGLANKRLEFHK